MANRFTYADLTYLEEMSMGSTDVLVELVLLFLDQVPEYTDNLLSALTNLDFASLSLAAHKAKSSMAALGMHTMAADLERLESLSNKGENPELYEEIVKKFIDQITQSCIELEDYIDSAAYSKGVPQNNG